MDVQRRGNRDTLLDGQNMPLHIAYAAAGGTVQMKAGDNVVICDTALVSADNTAFLVLPSLAEAVGQFYCIVVPKAATGSDISLWEKETGAELATNGDMDADDDHIILYSDGSKWRTILDGVA